MTRPDHGALADEAARLLGVAQQWLHRAIDDQSTTRIANGSPQCCWCPVCQLIATLRGDRPEISERLADIQTALLGLLRALTDVPGTAGNPRRESSRVHKIDLDTDSPDGDSPDSDSPDSDSPDGDSPDGVSPDGVSPDGGRL